MFQLCVVWLCLPNLKETLLKGGRGPGTFYRDGGKGGAVPRGCTTASHFPLSGLVSPHSPLFCLGLHACSAWSQTQKSTHSLLGLGRALPGDHGKKSALSSGQTAFSYLQ